MTESDTRIWAYKSFDSILLHHGEESWGAAWEVTSSRTQSLTGRAGTRCFPVVSCQSRPFSFALLPLCRHRPHPLWTLRFWGSEGQTSPLAIVCIWKWLSTGALPKVHSCDWKTLRGHCRLARTALCWTVVVLVLLFVTQVCFFKSYTFQR